MSVGRKNNKAIYIALDTETQLLQDDSGTVTEIEKSKYRIKLATERLKNGLISKDKYKRVNKIERKKIEQNEPFLCDQIQTYALAWEQLRDKPQEKNYYKKQMQAHEKHSGDFFKCNECLKAMAKKVKVLTDIDNNKNVWLQFFESMIKRYKSIRSGKSSYLRVYVHNLKFDARALEYVIIEHPELFTEVKTIVNNGRYYSIEFYYKDHKFMFVDSLKLLAMPLEKIGKMVGVTKKTELANYDWFDLNNKKLLTDEIEYLRFDVMVLLRGMDFIRSTLGLTSLTMAGFAKKNMQYFIRQDDRHRGLKQFSKIFKTGFTEEQDKYIRRSYYGGHTLVMPGQNNKIKSVGFSLDCNSMYPAAMQKVMPDPSSLRIMTASECQDFFMKAMKDVTNKFGILQIELTKLELKKDGVPFFPKKVSRFAQTQSIKCLDDIIDTDVEKSYLGTFTILDLYIICNEYDVEFYFVDGIKFVNTLYRPFDNFIQYHAKNKIKASREHNKELKFVSKVCLNSSYGKLGERFHDTESTLVNIDDEPIYIDEPVDKDWEQKGNIVIASFITAYARFNLYEQAKKIMDHDKTTLNYVDTDSIHFSYHGSHRPEIDSFIKKIRNNEDYNEDKLEQTFIKICDEIGVEYDPAEFGKWKIEGFFDKCVYLDAKRYIENDLFIGDNIKVAGVQQVGRDYLKKKGMKYFMYARDKNIVVPFVMLERVYGGYKFINSYKLLTPQANANGYII